MKGAGQTGPISTFNSLIIISRWDGFQDLDIRVKILIGEERECGREVLKKRICQKS